MSNRFFNFVTQFVSGTVAKSSEVNDKFQQLETAAAAIELELNTALKMPSAESATNVRFTDNAGARANELLMFDGSGNITNSLVLGADLSMGSNSLTNVADAVSAQDAVTLSQMQAYAGSLAGVPSITGQDGPLTTDGATVTWSARATTLLPTAPSDDGRGLVYTNGAWRTLFTSANLAFDPNGYLGSKFWTTSLNSVVNQKGYYWTNNAPLAAATFDHIPSDLGFMPMANGTTINLSPVINSAGVTAGTIELLFRYYDGSQVFLSESTPTAITNGAGNTRYRHSATTPVSTAYVKAVVRFTNVTCTAAGFDLFQLKVERSSNSSPWSDDQTIGYALSYKAQTELGYGFATPIVTIGNATATTATLDFRSEAGAQVYDARIRSSGGTNGTDGKASLAITAKSLTCTGPIGYASEYNAGNAGAGLTIDFMANGPKQKVTLNAATPVLTISTVGLIVGQYQLKVVQDSGVARVASWVGFVAADCMGGAVPVITTTLSGVTFVYLYWDGTKFWVSSTDWN